MIAAAVANDGTLMTPYLVKELQAPDLTVLDQTEPEQLSHARSRRDVAGQLTPMMAASSTNGTGRSGADPRRRGRRQDRHRRERARHAAARLVHRVRRPTPASRSRSR